MPGKKNSGKLVKSVPVQYDHAETVEKLAKTLIPKYHSHLSQCKIAYIYKNKPMKAKGKHVVATAEKVSAKHQLLSGYHFVITVAYPTWNELDDKIKLAVIDHELEHCFVDEDEKTGEMKYSILPHDVEEFSSIIKRHGLYRTDLLRIGRVVSDAMDNISDDVVVTKLGKPNGDEDAQEIDDDLVGVSRKELKKYIKEEGIDFKVKKSMSEDDIRRGLTKLRDHGEVEVDEDDIQDFDEDDDEEFMSVDV